MATNKQPISRSFMKMMKRPLRRNMINSSSCTSSDLLSIATGDKCSYLDLFHVKSTGVEALHRDEVKHNSKVKSVPPEFRKKKVKLCRKKRASCEAWFIKDKGRGTFNHELTECQPNQTCCLVIQWWKETRQLTYLSLASSSMIDGSRKIICLSLTVCLSLQTL